VFILPILSPVESRPKSRANSHGVAECGSFSLRKLKDKRSTAGQRIGKACVIAVVVVLYAMFAAAVIVLAN
jgi:hypothetical protein